MIGGRYALIRAYKDIFSTDSGKMVLHDLLRPIFRTSIVGGEANSVREGERNVALKILQMIQFDDKELQKLFEEARGLHGNRNNDDNDIRTGGW